MKYFVYRVFVLACIIFLCMIVPDTTLGQLFVPKEVFLVLCGSILFSITPFVQYIKKKGFFALGNLRSLFAQNALVSGVFISLIYILADINTLQFLSAEDSSVSSILVLKNMRPVLYGVLLWIALYTDNTKNETKDIETPVSDCDSTKTEVEARSGLALLSRREQEVARLAAKGLTNLQIATSLYISEATVKRHMATIFQKMDISSRRDLCHL